LLLDEPTIGLDVVSQRKVQEFLKFYQAEQKITVLLTSHYMKDVEALCERAIIINEGRIKHDGPLADIVDRFSRHKIMDAAVRRRRNPDDLDRYGTVVESRPPRVKLEVPATRFPKSSPRCCRSTPSKTSACRNARSKKSSRKSSRTGTTTTPPGKPPSA
jgi:ABC-2 type transport system ATP-binding protein